ncbi:CLT1 protein [Nymphaea thermarum]|nr:CLT1 protein [Nymphaea thermarum]
MAVALDRPVSSPAGQIQATGRAFRRPAAIASFLRGGFAKAALHSQRPLVHDQPQRWIVVAGGRRIGYQEVRRVACCCSTEGRILGLDLKAEKERRRVDVVVAAVMTVILGVGNRVLYKLALVPLKHYPFFLAQLATFGYLVVYFSFLYLRHKSGIITDEMLSLPKHRFVTVGLLEALGAVCGMAAGAMLPGASIPILSQSFLVWQLLLSTVFLGRRYKTNQIFGCLLVTVGVIITVASGSGAGQSLKEAGIFWALMMITSFFFQAADTVVKEIIFLDAARQLKGHSLDLFVVNSYGSAFQALFICLLLPFLSKLWGVPFRELPSYLRDGAACFLNMGSLSSGCEGAPLLPLLFVSVNMAFNISLLHLIKISSALVSCLAATFSVPISVYVFTLPLPLLGVPSALPAGFITGAGILLIGLFMYTWQPFVGPSSKQAPIDH